MFVFELIIDFVIDSWFAVMEWIVPEKAFGKIARNILKIIVCIFTLVLFISLIFGIFAIISDNPFTHTIGKYMLFIPLCISVVQILLGIIVHIIENKKNNI